jgi:hypothetical protein
VDDVDGTRVAALEDPVEDLATHITELFADVLESFQANEEDEEAVQESDEDAP